MFYDLEPLKYSSPLNKAEENCFVMLDQAKAILKWSRPNVAVPKEQGYRYPPFTTWCAQKLVHFSPLFQSTLWKLVPLPSINSLLIWGNYHAQNIITSRWKSRQELLSCSSFSSLPSVFTAVCDCVCHSRKHHGSMALSSHSWYHEHFTSTGSNSRVILIIWETMRKSTRWIEWWTQQ